MPNTRDIRNRIKGVKNTAKITRAMQLVASSKMKKAQDQAMQGRPYAIQMAKLLFALGQKVDLEKFSHPFLEPRTVKKRGVLVISTDRGLCGPLNANLFRELANIDRHNSVFYCIGRKGRQFVARTARNLGADFSVSESPRFREIRPIAEYLIGEYTSGNIDSMEILYPRFRNTLVQVPTLVSLLPLNNFMEFVARELASACQSLNVDVREFLFEPDPETILNDLLPLFLKRQLYQLLLEARASEHSARMVAMKAATDNAKKLSDSLTLQYNKARQAGITQEILEITAAALN
ncbi:MAG: ATP synthase F1 subunit gamma [Verrucomicrobia bacterium]|nr:ATP synthase F1 subunit gamma [Verrucomicrobiota bacterium]